MHELGLAENLCNAVAEYAEGRTVAKIVIGIGAFSGVNRDAFQFCSETVFRQKLNDSVEIVLEQIHGKALCECRNEYETDDLLSSCPKCGSFVREMIEGKDLVLKSIEVE